MSLDIKYYSTSSASQSVFDDGGWNHITWHYIPEPPMEPPVLTLAEVNYLMRAAKKDVKLAKILQKLTVSDDAFEIELAFHQEPISESATPWQYAEEE
jgi:hypothetical protein